MKSFIKFSELKRLEIFRVALKNALSNPEIAKLLSRFGFTAEALNKGKALYDTTREAYDKALTAKTKRTGVYSKFRKTKNALAVVYTKATADSSIKEVLEKYNITSEELDAGLALIPEMEQIRADYLNEKGASQDATSAKYKAFDALEDWMEEFFDLSRVALRKQPQLMEALGILAKN